MTEKIFWRHIFGDFERPARRVRRIFIHCSASDKPEHDKPEVIHEWHLARGFSEIGYHYYIDKAGVVWTGRDLEYAPAAQKGHNLNTIAICCAGLSDFTVPTLSSLKKLCSEINREYAGEVTFHGHCEVDPQKTCPVFNYTAVLGLRDGGKMPLPEES